MQTPIRPRASAPAALWALALVSLFLNIALAVLLVVIVLSARQFASDTADALSDVGNQDINYTFRLNQTVPVRAEVPFTQDIIVPISQSINVDTVVTVSRELPVIGVIDLDVPIQASIPVQFDVPIVVSRTFPVSAEVPLNLEIPLNIRISETPFKATIDSVVRSLKAFAGR